MQILIPTLFVVLFALFFVQLRGIKGSRLNWWPAGVVVAGGTLGFLLLSNFSLSLMEWVILLLTLAFVPFIAFMLVLFIVNLLKAI
jgi:hypothetical protein